MFPPPSPSPLNATAPWKTLEAYAALINLPTLAALHAAEPDRTARWMVRVGGLAVDFSKTHLTAQLQALLESLATAENLPAQRQGLFRGDILNVTEKRAVLHTALRAPFGPDPEGLSGGIGPEVKALHARMKTVIDAVHTGAWRGATGQPITDILHIGIGGSDLGPRLVVKALHPAHARNAGAPSSPRVHFVANIDAAEITRALAVCNPATTLVVVVSKTFTTLETLCNAEAARAWLRNALGPEALARHVLVVSSAAPEKLSAWGLTPESVFPLADSVGGRFSLWSAVGLSIGFALGWNTFATLLRGAAQMDAHFANAPMEKNLPILLGLVGIWYRNFQGTSCHVIAPYTERLRDLPRYVQQLEMESNGKSVTREGHPVTYATAPAVFGECGTVGQHGFHQWLHQGTASATVDFIGLDDDPLNPPDRHRALNQNLEAQAEALAFGDNDPDPAKANPGNRPSVTLTLERLDAETLGILLALYEHKVFVQGAIWRINSFDQGGVELGKRLARAKASFPLRKEPCEAEAFLDGVAKGT